MILAWRRRPEIAAMMFSDVADDVERQRAWLARSADRDDYLHRIIRLNGVACGLGSITVTHPDWRVGQIGVYMVDRAGATGMGPFYFTYMLNHAFFTLGLRKLVNHVLDGNARLLKGHRLAGYREVGVLKAHAMRAGVARDVHVFEMMREAWVSLRHRYNILEDMDGRVWDGPGLAGGDGDGM